MTTENNQNNYNMPTVNSPYSFLVACLDFNLALLDSNLGVEFNASESYMVYLRVTMKVVKIQVIKRFQRRPLSSSRAHRQCGAFKRKWCLPALPRVSLNTIIFDSDIDK